MIFLIDDKRTRQEQDFNWTKERLELYNNDLCGIYTLNELQERADEVFVDGNIVLYHESFLDNTDLKDKSADKRRELEEFTNKSTNFKLAIFSGSKNSRKLDKNVAYLSASILYQNLEVFIKKVQEGDIDLKYLLFGQNPKIEEELINKLYEANAKIDSEPAHISKYKNLFVSTAVNDIQNPIVDASIVTIFDEITDSDFSEMVNVWFQKEYDNIFIPLCFGEVLSDYNGLRLAVHIRCTSTINQLKNIFIYSFVGIEYLIDNTYFNIIKTKNVILVDYRKKAFEIAGNANYQSISSEELPRIISFLKLDPPNNYDDSHSVANEWAIYRWSNSLGIDLNVDLSKVFEKVESNLYFKYLKTIHPTNQIVKINPDRLKIKNQNNAKILLIDDQEDNGWNELMAYILADLNKIYSDSLGQDFRDLTREQIIEKSLMAIVENDYDVIILDFRLHPLDFYSSSLQEVTGLRLLKKIKELNRGIQVVVFSATNKVWNYQALQNAGSDGFIIKESFDNSLDSNFTLDVINSFISTISMAIQRTFLKKLFLILKQTKNNINNFECYDCDAFCDFIKDLKSQLLLIDMSLRNINLEFSTTLDIVFLNCYNFLEKFKRHYVREVKNHFVIGIEEAEMNRYTYLDGKANDEGKFIRNDKYDYPSWFNSLAGIFIDYFLITDCKGNDIKDLNRIKDQRNSYIHGKNKIKPDDLLSILSLCETITRHIKE